MAEVVVVLDLLEQLPAVVLRQVQIEQDQVGPWRTFVRTPLVEEVEPFLTIVRDVKVVVDLVVLTTSSAEEDILRSYKLHANAYVTKPVDLDQFMSAVRQIDEFFVQVVKLPKP